MSREKVYRQSSRGVPPNLKPLAKMGLRIRFNGFWLNESEYDRIIAKWIDETPNAAAIIKHMIYAMATGSHQIMTTRNAAPQKAAKESGEATFALANFDD